ncbi:hybrid sensor histidine kinase/response regulator transcription factor [Flammeovirga agarivorans]|uniref:histidine kinase n=1 Tax=Flammeovirga agarivorans TaxID=2726742 RepID=A0A7X8SNH7_9BACT|nr:hybrid sensor histidine kinase/response regulator transcription factor [Flammeovirga agarivorans]NLR93413.1 response regulator [Flammeovirga agarivorans]
MRKFYYLLSFIVLIFFFVDVTAQPKNISNEGLTNYGINDGVSHYGVTALIEDHKGLIWLGTYNGLDRYNGYDFKNFRNSDYEKILSDNKIRSLYQDEKNNIWVGTENGLNVFIYDEQKIQIIPTANIVSKSDQPCIIAKIIPFKNHIVCVTEYEGLLFYNKDTYQLERVHSIEIKDKVFQYVYDALPMGDNTILISTAKGLIAYNSESDHHEYILEENISSCKGIAKDASNNIYVAEYNGISFIKAKQHNGSYQFHYVKKFFPNARFRALAIDDKDQLWAGMLSKGIALFKNPNSFTEKEKYRRNKCDRYLEIGRVSDIISEKENNEIWIASLSDGLFTFDKNASPFKYADLNTVELRGRHFNNKILEGCVWDDEHILLSSYLRGLVYYNTKTEKLAPLPEEFKNSPLPVKWTSIIKDNKGGKWMRFTRERGQWYYQKPNDKKNWIAVKSNEISEMTYSKFYQIEVDKFGYYWVATNNGLFRLKLDEKGNITTGEKLSENPNTQIANASQFRTIMIDSLNNSVWVGTTLSGLLKFHNADGVCINDMQVDQYKNENNKSSSLPSNHVSNIVLLPNGSVCVGLEGKGLCIIEDDSKDKLKYSCYSEKDGLDNNIVKKIVYDEKNKLWITTDKGLNLFDLETKTFKQFTVEDGIHAYAFENVGFKQNDHKIVFAAGNGICFFDPAKTDIEKPLPPFSFGDLVLLNTTINVNDTINNRVILDKPLDQKKKITLRYDENIFSIELLLLHYSNYPSSYKIKYRLLPQDDEWIETTSEFKNISFNGIAPGKYTLEAKASNSKNNWTAPISLNIVVRPPFWKTPFAYFLYFVLLCAIVFIVIRFMLNHTHLKHELELEHVERMRVDELNKTKERIFMNISHEFRTPITLITGPIQMLLNMFSSNKDAFVHLDLIHRQSNKMLQLVNQVQDFHKAEQSILKLKSENFDFTGLVMDMKKDFDSLAQKQEKHLEIEGDANQLFITADRYKIEIVLNNLLNNAFKFTKKGDTVKIQYGYDEQSLFFKVIDTGIGIEKENLPYVFDRFYQSENSNTYSIGSGIGLAFSKRLVEMHFGKISIESEVGEGTTFSVTLPVKVNAKEILNENRMQDILSNETDDEKQKILPTTLELPSYLMDESLKELNVFYVEDNEELRTFVSDVLSEYFNVTCFENGKECLNTLENEWPDLIISDILMPEVNGLELCQKLKTDIRTSHIPIILLTSRSSIDDQVKGLEVGADFYISKPFDMKHLVASSQMLLKNRKQLRERFQIDFPVEVEKKNTNKDDAIFIEKFYELIEENLENEDIDMNVFAKGLYLNRTTFFQKVKAITNYTPYELLKVYRLKKAAEFLVQENLPVAEVCVRTGFKNRTHFSRMFKEYYGVSPSKYSKSLEEKA